MSLNPTLIPPHWYHDPKIFALEQELIGSKAWHYVGLTEKLAEPGDYFAAKIGEVPIVVVRDRKGNLRAFVNVCKHRGAEIILESKPGNAQLLMCHYHAWTWDLEGNFKSAPGMKITDGVEKERLALKPLKVQTLDRFVFVSLDANAVPWTQLVGQLPELLQASGTDFKSLVYRGAKAFPMKANWKLVVENFLECYHCPISHPSFTKLIDINKYTVTPYEYFSVQQGTAKAGTVDATYDSQPLNQVGYYNYLWPFFMVNTYPGLPNASTNLVIPIDADHTVAIYEFFLDERIKAPHDQEIIDLIKEVQEEDVVIVESVHRGLRSGYYKEGRLMLEKENGVAHFQNLVLKALESSAAPGPSR
jgi:choline monooxygenase